VERSLMYRVQKVLPYVIQVIAMALNETESLQYLESQGFKISARYLYKLKNKVKQNRNSRLALIAKSEFRDQHIQRLEQLEVIQKEYWKLYRAEKKVINKASILEKIVQVQQYISSYYDASRYVMEQSIIQPEKKKRKKVIMENEQ